MMQQMLEFTGTLIAASALDIEDIHHQALGESMPSHRHAGLVAAFPAQVDTLTTDLDISQANQFRQSLVVLLDLQDVKMGRVFTFLFGNNP
jgi:hypothetical protein